MDQDARQVRPGDPISATEYNKVVDASNRSRRPFGVGGAEVALGTTTVIYSATL